MKNIHTIKVEVKGKEWTSAIDEAFNKKKKDIKIDGFRKGSVTKDLYIKKVGVESLYMDATDIALNSAYTKVLKDNKLIPVVEPKMNIIGIDDKHVEFEFTIITKPEVKLGKYTKLGVKKDAVKVTKKEIDEEIKSLSSKYAEVAVKESGSVEDGNTAVIDFEGFVDGKVLEGGTGANYPLEIGSHTFIPGFEEGLIGMSVGDSKELNLKFPENYTEELKNKEVLFKVKVNEIKERKLPELTKEFYLDLGFDKVETEAEFRTEIENKIKTKKEAEVEDKFINECLETAAKEMKVEINPEIISDEVHRMIHQFEEQLKMQGLNIDQYFQFTGMTHEKIHEQMNPEATKRVTYRYLLEGIADAEKIEISDKDAKAEAKNMAEGYGMKEADFLDSFGGLDIVKYDLKMRAAMEVIKK